MSNEEYERIIEFILEQQAQFSASVQEHNERFARNEELISRNGEQIGLIGERMIQLEDVVNRLAAVTLTGFKDVGAKIDALVDSHIRLPDAQARTEEAQKRTEESLRSLIESLERDIRGRRNGERKRDEE